MFRDSAEIIVHRSNARMWFLTITITITILTITNLVNPIDIVDLNNPKVREGENCFITITIAITITIT